MKKSSILQSVILLLALLLSACGGSNSATDGTSNAEAVGTPMPGAGLSDNMKLLLGILSLADSDAPLTVEQASAMLPLWKAVRALGESDTAAQVEIDALYTQIRGTLTEEQLTVIDDMALDMESMASLSEKLGIAGGFVGRGDMPPEMQATMQALRDSGEMPMIVTSGDFPEGMEIPEDAPMFEIQASGDASASGVVIEGGPGMGGGRMFGDASGLSPEQMATAQASGVKLPVLRDMVGGPWLDALIGMLEGIVNGE